MTSADADPAAEGRAVARARAGDASAFRAIYDAHAGRVYALCLRLTADPDEAREATQDAFVRAWQKLGAFRGESGVGTWIHRIAVNAVLERRRAERRRIGRLGPIDEDGAWEPAARPDRVEERMDLDAALATLSPEARTVFVLREIEGYDYREISALTGASEVALRSQLHRARRALMERLRP